MIEISKMKTVCYFAIDKFVACLIVIHVLSFSGCSATIPAQLPINLQNQYYLFSGKVLLVVAHQDDEAFIVSRLHQHLKENDTIRIVWTAQSSQLSKEYSEMRKIESIKAMSLLGIDSSCCVFLNYVDGETHNVLQKILDTLQIIISEYKPSTIYIPAFEGGHIDHDIVNFAVATIVKKMNDKPHVIEFPLYSAYSTGGILPYKMRSYPAEALTFVRLVTDKEFNIVIKVWEVYQSQKFPFEVYMDIVDGREKVFGYEYLRILGQYDYEKRPWNQNIAYERFLPVKFDEFVKAIKTIK
jgi:LmbE family N-acetylglucosaminyl deacetylase